MIINIGRQLGSGGHEIGEKLAIGLGITFYDKELLRLAAKESGFRPELFEQADECARKAHTGGFLGIHMPFFGDSALTTTGLTQEGLFQIQSDVIRQQAEKGNCVFVGRCADYILRDRTDCLNIFISANRTDRLRRLMERHDYTEKQAADLLDKTDRQRADFYNFYTEKTWGQADSYHLCINSSVLTIDGTVSFIKQFVHDALN